MMHGVNVAIDFGMMQKSMTPIKPSVINQHKHKKTAYGIKRRIVKNVGINLSVSFCGEI